MDPHPNAPPKLKVVTGSQPEIPPEITDCEARLAATCLHGHAREVLKHIEPHYFSVPRYARILEKCRALIAEGIEPDLLTISKDEPHSIIVQNADLIELRSLGDANLEWPAQQIKHGYRLRQTKAIGIEIYEHPERAGQALERLAAIDKPSGLVRFNLCGTSLTDIPPVRWIVPGWLAEEHIAVIWGGPKVGKSTICAYTACCIAKAEPWFGHAMTQPRPVLFVDAEQSENQSLRLLLRLGAPQDGRISLVSGVGLSLGSGDGLDDLEREIEALRGSWGVPPVVVLDTWQQLSGMMDEADNAEAGRIFARLFRLRQRHGCTFLIDHHRRKLQQGMSVTQVTGDDMRGAGAIATQADSTWFVDRQGALVELRMTSSREAMQPDMRIVPTHTDDRITFDFAEADGVELSESDRCIRMIVNLLRERGPLGRRELLAALAASGVRQRTVERSLRQALISGEVRQPAKRGAFYLPDSVMEL